MTTLLAAVTAAHPYWSGIGIWLIVGLIATGIWALCKERTSEDDDDPLVTGPVDATTRGNLTIVIGTLDKSSYTPPSLTGKASKGFRRVS